LTPTLENIRKFKPAIMEAAQTYGVSNIRVFGSVARGEADEESDVDFLVDFAPRRSFLDLMRFLGKLRDLIGKKVDVVSSDCVKERIRERVFREAVNL
jgi:uncharacterized protein